MYRLGPTGPYLLHGMALLQSLVHGLDLALLSQNPASYCVAEAAKRANLTIFTNLQCTRHLLQSAEGKPTQRGVGMVMGKERAGATGAAASQCVTPRGVR